MTTPYENIRATFIAWGYPEARHWTDEQIDKGSADLIATMSKTGVSLEQFDTAFKRLHAVINGSTDVPQPTPTELPQTNTK